MEKQIAKIKNCDIENTSSEELIELVGTMRGLSNNFYCSDEYRNIYPTLKKMTDEAVRRHKTNLEKIMFEAGINYGDKVACTYLGAFLATEYYEGIVVRSKKRPRVKLLKGYAGNKKSLQ